MADTAQRQGLGGGTRAMFGAVAGTDSFKADFAALTASATADGLTCLLVDPPMGLALLAAHAVGSSGLAATYLGVLDEFTSGIEATKRRRDADGCLTCESGAFFRRHPPAIIAVLATPAFGAAVPACVVAGICHGCARRAGWPDGLPDGRPWKSGLLAAMEPPLRRLWPHLRTLRVHPVAGTA
jgi:hypothetical protein